MIGDGIAPLTQERQELENPCCNCKESGVSMTCRCDDRIKYDIERQNVAKSSKDGKMKTIEEMIATYTPEEWQKIIKDEMDELGLCFVEDTEYQKENLFED